MTKRIKLAVVAAVAVLFGSVGVERVVNSTQIQGLISTPTSYIRAGAEQNLSRIPAAWTPPSAPVGTGTLVTVPATLSAIQSAYNAAAPGSIIQVQNGTIVGALNVANILMNRSFSASAPVVIRAQNRHGVTMQGCGGPWAGAYSCVNLTGAYNFLQGFRFTATGAQVVAIDGLHNTIYDNKFAAAGTDTTCDSVGLVGVSGSNSLTGNLAVRQAGVIRNEFDQPRGCAIMMEHGSGGNMFSHNIITGQTGITSFYNYPFRIGWHFGYLDTSSPTIQFNTVRNYGTWGVGWNDIKISGTKLLYNLMDNSQCPGCRGQQLNIRAADNSIVVGNLGVGPDAWASFSGNNLLARYNKFISSYSSFHKGALNMLPTACRNDGLYCGPPPDGPMTKALTNSTVTDNAFVTFSTYSATATQITTNDTGTNLGLPSGNTFADNFWARKNNPSSWWGSPFGQSATSAGTWSGNRFLCSYGCSGAVSFAGVLGTNGNTVSQPWTEMFPDMSAAPTEAELLNPLQLMVCDPTYVGDCPGAPPVTATTLATTSTTTTTVVPPPPASLCAGGTRYEAEAMSQVGMAVSSDGLASGGAVLGSMLSPAQVQWTHTGPYAEMRFRYYATAGATRQLTGPNATTVMFPTSAVLTTHVVLASGSGTNTHGLSITSDGLGGMAFDFVDMCPSVSATTTTTTTSTTSTTSTTTTSTTTLPTTTTTLPSTCVTVQSESGSVFGGAAVLSEPLAAGGQIVGWSAIGSGFTVSVSLAAGPWVMTETYRSIGGGSASMSSPIFGTATYPHSPTFVAATPLNFTAPGGSMSLTVTRASGGLASDQLVFCPGLPPTSTTSTSTTTLPGGSLPRLCRNGVQITTPGCIPRSTVTIVPRTTRNPALPTIVAPRTTRP